MTKLSKHHIREPTNRLGKLCIKGFNVLEIQRQTFNDRSRRVPRSHTGRREFIINYPTTGGQCRLSRLDADEITRAGTFFILQTGHLKRSPPRSFSDLPTRRHSFQPRRWIPPASSSTLCSIVVLLAISYSTERLVRGQVPRTCSILVLFGSVLVVLCAAREIHLAALARPEGFAVYPAIFNHRRDLVELRCPFRHLPW